MHANKETDLEMDEFRDWVAGRKAAAATINIEICELQWCYGEILDPYGLLKAQSELPEEVRQVGQHHFVRSADSDGWVHERDLSPAQRKAMHARFEREYRECGDVPF